MNAAFSILQKIKGQFLQSTPNKADFQVAFAPFAFSLASDDFYFLRNNAVTGAQARKYLKEQSEFSFMANSVLKTPNLWKIDGESLLYDSYRQVLNHALVIDPDAMSADETARISRARTVLFTAAGNDSAKYKAYRRYAAMAAELDRKIIDLNATRSAIPEGDSGALGKWTIEVQALADTKKELLIEWQVKGNKAAVEAAKASYEAIVLSKAAFIERWHDARNVRMAAPNLMTDEFGVDFLATTCIPNAICDYQAPIWKKLVLGKTEIAQLTQSFTDEVPAGVLAAFGDVQPDLDTISFEYCLLDIQRPWFDESLINNRLWKFADASQLLSSGDDAMSGLLPAYPVKMILAKNIDLQFTPNSPVNDNIKLQLRNGNRLLFGPLLLKTIPTNLTDDKISGFRVQTLTTPDLAVLTRVALQGGAAAPPKTAVVNRIQMIQVLNQRPQVLMRPGSSTAPRIAATKASPSRAAMATPPSAQPRAGGIVRPGLMVRPDLIDRRPGMPPFVRPPMPPTVIGPPAPAPPAPTPPAPASPAPSVSLVGKVLDNVGAAVPVAELQIISLTSGANQSVLSGDDGSYGLKDIAPGRYQLKARKTGFVTQDRTLELSANATQDFLLEAQAELTETFQVIGVICKRLPRLPNPQPDSSYV